MLVSNIGSFYLDDTEWQARQAGVNYRPVLDAALKRDRRALHTLFQLTADNAFDGAGADSHSCALWTLMAQWGDRDFAKALAAEPARIRQAVITFLDYAAAEDYSKTYPLTHRLGLHTSFQSRLLLAPQAASNGLFVALLGDSQTH